MKPQNKRRTRVKIEDHPHWTEPDVILDEDVDDKDFECFVEEVTASDSSEEEFISTRRSPKKTANKVVNPRMSKPRADTKPKLPVGRPKGKASKNGNVSKGKKNHLNRPVKVKIEDEAQLTSKSRRTVKPIKYSEYVMTIDSSENENLSSDDYSNSDVSRVKASTSKRGRRRTTNDESDESDSDSQPNSRKRPRHYLSLRDKIRLLRRFDAIQPCKQTEASKLFGIRNTTFSTIIAHREELEKRYKNSPKWDDSKENLQTLEEALVDFAKKQESNNVSVTWQQLKKKSEELMKSFNSPRVDIDEKWLVKWKKNFEKSKKKLSNIDDLDRLREALTDSVEKSRLEGVEMTWDEIKTKCRSLQGSMGLGELEVTENCLLKWKNKLDREAKRMRTPKSSLIIDSESKENVDGWSGAVRAALKDFHPDNVFNAVESGIYHKSLPGAQNSKADWMTVLFVSNMSGTEKRKLLVIGKSHQLMMGILTLPVDFKANDNAWMTPDIFTDFITEWNCALEKLQRRIALIVEESQAHPFVNLKWVKLFYVPRNTDGSQPPLKLGIISLVKMLYRKELVKAVSRLARGSSQIQNTADMISVGDAAFMLSGAWSSVDKSAMVTAFMKSGFPFLHNSSTTGMNDDDENVDICSLNEEDERIIVHEQPRDLHSALVVDAHQGCINEVIVHADEEPVDDGPSTDIGFQDSNSYQEQLNGDKERDKTDPSHLSDVDSGKRDVTSPCLRPTSSSSSLTEDMVWSLGPASSAELPSDSKVLDALATIKRFLKIKNGTLEDLTEYTQLELKVLAKMPSQ